jgi:hypothetical protein
MAANGFVGVGSTSPWAQFSINPNDVGTAPVFAVGSSSATKFVIDPSGEVGIGARSNGTGILSIGGTYRTGSGAHVSIAGTYLSSNTSNQYALLVNPSITPQGASLGSIMGLYVIPTISGIPSAGTTYEGVRSALLGAVLGGTITSGNAFSAAPPITAASNPVTTYAHFKGETITNGNGTTTGTVTNYGVFLTGITAAAGSGGTINNYGINLTVPSGTGAGTTNNYGLYLTGNTAGAYSLYNNSTSNSYFAGKIGLGTTSPYASLSVQSNFGDTTNTLFAIGSSTSASATTTLFAIDRSGIITSKSLLLTYS